MADEYEYKTLKELYEAYSDWEVNKKAYHFAHALWQIADNSINSKAIIKEEELPFRTFQYLLQNKCFAKCITDNFRKIVVRYHARGYSTSKAIKAILYDDSMQYITPFWTFKHSNVCSYDGIHTLLVERTSYLKPTHKRFPHKKFGSVWTTEREQYLKQLPDIPLMNPSVQAAKQAEHYEKLEEMFDNAQILQDKIKIHRCMTQTMFSIHGITRDPSINPPKAITQENTPYAIEKPKDEIVVDVDATEVLDPKKAD